MCIWTVHGNGRTSSLVSLHRCIVASLHCCIVESLVGGWLQCCIVAVNVVVVVVVASSFVVVSQSVSFAFVR